MQYALLVYTEPCYHEMLSAEEQDRLVAEFAHLADDPRCLSVARLGSAQTANAVRLAGGRTLVTDGPFADTKEVLGGLCLIEVADLEEALEMAARVPAARFSGGVEVRLVES